jgi:hypothetical protein
MADSAQISTGFNTLVTNHFSATLRNTLFNRMPLIYFLFAKDGDKNGVTGLGRPKTATFLSQISTAKAKKEEILSSPAYEPFIQTSGPAITDGKVMGMRDRMPARSSWDTTSPSTYFTRPRFKWVERAEPYKIPNKEIRRTTRKAANELDKWKGITSLFNAETTSVLATHLKWWNQRLWGTGYMADGVTANTGIPTSEDAEVWDNPHSLQNALKSGTGTYGGIDRSVSTNSWWDGKYSTTATPAVAEDIINYLNYDQGFSRVGSGIDLIITDGPNFKKFKKEAKAKGQTCYTDTAIPSFGQFGFKNEIVKVDNTYICYDPECPTNHLAALNLDTWTFAIHPDANFKVSTPTDMSKFEGGDDAQTGHIRTEILLACEVPSVNAYFTAVS